jgi:sulfide:quinone oxidoreductase
MPARPDRYRVLIAGGGVAALEAMVALRTLAENRVDIELLAPDRDFFYRPLAVTEPFGTGEALRFDIRALATDCGAQHRLGSLAAVSPSKHQATTGHGDPLHYDSLILATGARQYIAVPGALTYRGSQDSPAFSRILAEALSGDIKTLAFVVPSRVTWPLPLYELALRRDWQKRTSKWRSASSHRRRRRSASSGTVGQRPSPVFSPTRASSS